MVTKLITLMIHNVTTILFWILNKPATCKQLILEKKEILPHPPHYLIDIIGFGSIVRTHCCSQTHINHRICNFRISTFVFNRIHVND